MPPFLPDHSSHELPALPGGLIISTCLCTSLCPQQIGRSSRRTATAPVGRRAADACRPADKVVWKWTSPPAGPARHQRRQTDPFHRVGDNERGDCLDPASGKKVWTGEYPTAYQDDFNFDEGPRGTPAIADKKVFTFGAEAN